MSSTYWSWPSPTCWRIGQEVALRGGVGLDLGQALVLVGDDVDAREALERERVDDVGGAVPVVADVEDVAGGGRGAGHGDQQRGEGGQQQLR